MELLRQRLAEADALELHISPAYTHMFDECIALIRKDNCGFYHSMADVKRILGDVPCTDRVTLLRFAVYVLAREAVERMEGCSYPDAVKKEFLGWLSRILKDLRVKGDEWYTLDNELLVKDIGVSSLRFYPVGLLVVGHSPLPRKPVLRTGMQLIKNFHYIFDSKNYYEMHLDKRTMRHFNPEGAEESYRNFASMLLKEDWKGIFGGGWLHDPSLKEIAPEVSFLNDIPLANGAQLLPGITTPQFIEGAIKLSRERARLYQEGIYKPRKFFLCWKRKDILRWYNAL